MKTNKKQARTAGILADLRRLGTMAVSELAARYNVSEETIRRDAHQLELRGEIIKTHGSLHLPPHHFEASFESRMREHAEAKLAIARTAIDIVQEGDSLIVDTGTTTTFFARELRQRKNLTVITNSTEIARLLAPVTGNRVFLAGGEVSAHDSAAYGPTTAEFVSRFNPKFAFLSIGAIHAIYGPTDATLLEAEFGRTALRAASQCIILADASKFGRIELVKVCSLSDIDMVITDQMPDDQLAQSFRDNDVELRLSGMP